MMGAHVVKSGLSRLVIDLMARRFMRMWRATAPCQSDVELALIGATSEDVATSLEDGTFGMADETGRYMHRGSARGVRDGLGYGASIGRFTWMAIPSSSCREGLDPLESTYYRLGIPATIHVTIGTDIIHQHPAADFTVLGTASGRDFLSFCTSLSDLEGSVFLNFGSAVTGPEVFLKALTIVRNHRILCPRITTANFDLIVGI